MKMQMYVFNTDCNPLPWKLRCKGIDGGIVIQLGGLDLKNI